MEPVVTPVYIEPENTTLPANETAPVANETSPGVIYLIPHHIVSTETESLYRQYVEYDISVELQDFRVSLLGHCVDKVYTFGIISILLESACVVADMLMQKGESMTH